MDEGPQCINLRDRFGDRYQLTYDPAYFGHVDPWYMQIPCRDGGTIFPHGGDLLAYEFTSKSSRRLNRLIALGCKVHQDGSEERCVLFHVDLFPKVAEIAKPRRKRRGTPESVDRLWAYRFSEMRSGACAAPLTAS